MGFSISNGIGDSVVSILVAILLASAAAILLFWLISAVRRARDDVVEAENNDPDIVA